MTSMSENPNFVRRHILDQNYGRADFPLDEEGSRRAVETLIHMSHGVSVATGWHRDIHTGEIINHNVGERLMLMVSEISEAMEGDRKGLMDDHLPHRLAIEVELADALHRIFDFAGKHGLDLAGAYVDKAEYNLVRQDHKVEARRLPGGKSY